MADGNKNNALADSDLLARIAAALERLAPAALTGTLPAGEAARLSMYAAPPTGALSIEEFESTALDRLRGE